GNSEGNSNAYTPQNGGNNGGGVLGNYNPQHYTPQNAEEVQKAVEILKKSGVPDSKIQQWTEAVMGVNGKTPDQILTPALLKELATMPPEVAKQVIDKLMNNETVWSSQDAPIFQDSSPLLSAMANFANSYAGQPLTSLES
ncbi:MAG: hypothetical protein ACKVTZ_18340, partial [Bacteroidia bacterium]